MKKIACLLAVLSCHLFSSSQVLPVNDKELALRYSFINTAQNRIFNSSSLHSFYKKLSELRDSSRKTVSIVHIGDSHIQADFLSGVIRDKLQKNFGNAGRGLVFPYQLAQSNAPSDIACSSDTRWQFNRVAHPEIPISPGVSGFVLETNNPTATLSITLKDASAGFDRVRLFASTPSRWAIKTTESYDLELADSVTSNELVLDEHNSTAFFTSQYTGNRTSFYGVSLENSMSGILYHTIGVNGARYDHYNRADIFWKQLGDLRADLYIISLGTNEAQAATINSAELKKQISLFIEKIRAVSPDASILITTAPDSYKRGKSNAAMKIVNEVIAAYCDENRLAIWNLYKASNGFGSAYSWNRRKLMSRDRVHFTADGYRLQGSLLYNALAKSYNDFLSMGN